MAYVYLSKEIELGEDQSDAAVELAKTSLEKLYQELEVLFPALEAEANKLNPNWTVEVSGFDVEMVFCEDWFQGKWTASFMFKVSCKSPDGNAELDYEITEYDEWESVGKPMYKDVFEPLHKCSWVGFKRENVSVEFSAVKAVDSYRGDGLHFYNNHGWL